MSLCDITEKYACEIHKAVAEVINSEWYLLGKNVAAFEEQYAKYIGTEHCIGVANGLDALTLILKVYIEMGVMEMRLLSRPILILLLYWPFRKTGWYLSL